MSTLSDPLKNSTVLLHPTAARLFAELPDEPAAPNESTLVLTANQSLAIDHLWGNHHAILIAPTGTGKTAVALAAIQARLDYGTNKRAIVVAPPKVINNWPIEAAKWESTLKIALLTGNPAERAAMVKDTTKDVLVVSLNNLNSLLALNHGCDLILIDELSKATGKQTSKLKNKPADTIITRWAMTATPVSESFENLYAMCRIIDSGKALGRSKQSYLTKYFYPTDYKQYNWALQAGSDTKILEKVEHLIHIIDYKKEEFMAPIITDDYLFKLPAATLKRYDMMRKDMLVDLDDTTIVAANAAVMTSKLRQMASGFALNEDGAVIEYDNFRAEAASKWIEELEGRTAIILYEYNHQRDQLQRVLAQMEILFTCVYGGSDSEGSIAAFKDGAVQILVAQQSTLSHGVDGLQHVCADLLFFQPCWSKDINEQAQGRIHRQGQTKQVRVTYLVAENTVDDVVLTRLEDKSQHMSAFMDHLNKK